MPTPITRVSTIASRVMAGPMMAMPLAMLACTSCWEAELRENLASALAFPRSTNSRKNGSASLLRGQKGKV